MLISERPKMQLQAEALLHVTWLFLSTMTSSPGAMFSLLSSSQSFCYLSWSTGEVINKALIVPFFSTQTGSFLTVLVSVDRSRLHIRRLRPSPQCSPTDAMSYDSTNACLERGLPCVPFSPFPWSIASVSTWNYKALFQWSFILLLRCDSNIYHSN